MLRHLSQPLHTGCFHLHIGVKALSDGIDDQRLAFFAQQFGSQIAQDALRMLRDLLDRAMVDVPFLTDPNPPGRVVIKSISAKQRPRRPG